MGDLTWLQTLGVAVVTGLTGLVGWVIRQVIKGNLVPKVVLDREREISREWRQVAETYAENDRKHSEIVHRNNEALSRALVVLERAPWLDTESKDGSRGFRGYAVSEGIRPEPDETQDRRWS